MSRLVLDASPLARICHPRGKSPLNGEIARWLVAHLDGGTEIVVPEIADYEVRRELLRLGSSNGIAHLDSLRSTLTFLPISSMVMVRAAELWAQMRNQGTPTAPPEALDADVILAAQAEACGGVVATENVGHLARMTPAKHWRDLPPPD